MMKFIFVVVALVASIQMAQAGCSCPYCSSSGGKLPATCTTTGCTAQFFPADLSAINSTIGTVCATNKCFVGGTCPSYSMNGTTLASSSLANQYMGAFAAKIATPNLADVCYYTPQLTCPAGSCAVDLRQIPGGSSLGVWCATTGQPCPSGFTSVPVQFASSSALSNYIRGAIAEHVGCNNAYNQCVQSLDVGSM